MVCVDRFFRLLLGGLGRIDDCRLLVTQRGGTAKRRCAMQNLYPEMPILIDTIIVFTVK